MRFGRRDIGLIELDGRARKCALGVAALALHALSRRERRLDDLGLVIGLEVGIDIVFVPGVRHADRISGGLGALERVRDGERDKLAVVSNDVVLEWRSPLVGDALESGFLNGAEYLSDVCAMKNG